MKPDPLWRILVWLYFKIVVNVFKALLWLLGVKP